MKKFRNVFRNKMIAGKAIFMLLAFVFLHLKYSVQELFHKKICKQFKN